jgi:TonB family protein
MISHDCTRAEITAGAVALGEASDAERDAYRRHLSVCRRCLDGLGGEREVERTMQLVARARDGESWEPDVRVALRDRLHVNRRVWRFGLAAVAAVAVVSIGVRAWVPTAVKPDTQRVALSYRVFAGALEPPPHRPLAGHDLVVLHNVATLKRPPLASVAAAHPEAAAASKHAVRVAARPVMKSAAATVVAEAGPSQRDERSIAALRTVGTAPPLPQRAESIAVMPASTVNHDVVPLGGEGAIVPHPSAIAYYENAEGTTAFEVTVDERGLPVKCSVTKSSGYLVLDEAVCKAAMHARYVPRTINGRAVSSLYHDAFTFAAGSDDQ